MEGLFCSKCVLALRQAHRQCATRPGEENRLEAIEGFARSQPVTVGSPYSFKGIPLYAYEPFSASSAQIH